MTKVLYISYDGVTDALGQSQILPYIKEIAAKDIEFILLSFDKEAQSSSFNLKSMRQELANSKINWISIPYHKRPKLLAKAYDLITGMITCISIQRKNTIDLVHGRSFIGAILALFLKKVYKTRFLLDYRGLWPDERVDAGVWRRSGISYRVAKYLERSLLLNADEIVVLTKRAHNLIMEFPYLRNIEKKITVIPTCADLNLFRPAPGYNSPKKDKGPNILYLGSLGTWYMLDEMIDFFSVVHESFPAAHFTFLTRTANQRMIRRAMEERGLPDSAYSVREISYQQVPDYITMADLSLFFIKPLYSKISSCPTKLGESLACGLPVVINSGIGDCDRIVNDNRVGIVIDQLNIKTYPKYLSRVKEIINNKQTYSSRCRETAERNFSLKNAAQLYRSIYRKI